MDCRASTAYAINRAIRLSRICVYTVSIYSMYRPIGIDRNVWETCMVFFLQWCNSVFRGGGTYASNKDTCGPARGFMVGAGGRHPLLPGGFRGIQNLDSIVFGVFKYKIYNWLVKVGAGTIPIASPVPQKSGGTCPLCSPPRELHACLPTLLKHN